MVRGEFRQRGYNPTAADGIAWLTVRKDTNQTAVPDGVWIQTRAHSAVIHYQQTSPRALPHDRPAGSIQTSESTVLRRACAELSGPVQANRSSVWLWPSGPEDHGICLGHVPLWLGRWTVDRCAFPNQTPACGLVSMVRHWSDDSGECDRQHLAQFPQEGNTAEISGRCDAPRRSHELGAVRNRRPTVFLGVP